MTKFTSAKLKKEKGKRKTNLSTRVYYIIEFKDNRANNVDADERNI